MKPTKEPYVNNLMPYFSQTALIFCNGRASSSENCIHCQPGDDLGGSGTHLDLIRNNSDLACLFQDILADLLGMLRVKVAQSDCRYQFRACLGNLDEFEENVEVLL